MGRNILARIIIFSISILLLLYAIFVSTISFKGLNITAFHLSQPLLIGYSIFWLVVAPSGLWGIFGSIQNNPQLCARYLRDHWFSSALITVVEIVKVVFSFTMKDNAIKKCLESNNNSNEDCRKTVEFNQKLTLIVFGGQGFLLIFFGVIVWFCCKRLMPTTKGKIKVELDQDDLETQNSSELTDDSIRQLSSEQRRNVFSFTRHQSQQYSKRQSEQQNKQQDKQQINVNENEFDMSNILKSPPREGSNRNYGNSNKNDKFTTPQRHRKSYERHINTSTDELQRQPSQVMNPMAPISRSKGNNMLPPPPPEYQFMPIQYSQGVQGMQNNRVPSYYNRPLLPQLQPVPAFQPPHPWQQQWMIQNPPQGNYFRGHRRSKSQPELRPFPYAPRYPLPPQFLGQAIPPPQQKEIPSQRQQKNPVINGSTYDISNNNINKSQTIPTNSKRSSASSQYRRPSFVEQKRLSQMHRSNSLPNMSDHEDFMRNEMLFAPPVPSIPSSLQPSKDDNKNNKNKNLQSPIINNEDKFERFIRKYGDKDYNSFVSENPLYNKYSDINNGWGTNENDNYVPPRKPRPSSAHSVKGEASPKSSIYFEDDEGRYYNDYYSYYGSPSGYGMNREMNNGNNNYGYTQYVGPTGYYDYSRNFIPTGYNGGDNTLTQQRSQMY